MWNELTYILVGVYLIRFVSYTNNRGNQMSEKTGNVNNTDRAQIQETVLSAHYLEKQEEERLEKKRRRTNPTIKEKEDAMDKVFAIMRNLISSDKKDYASAKILAEIYGVEQEFRDFVLELTTNHITFF
jgi:hypothetical protein